MDRDTKKFKKACKRKDKLKRRNHINKAFRYKGINGKLVPIHEHMQWRLP